MINPDNLLITITNTIAQNTQAGVIMSIEVLLCAILPLIFMRLSGLHGLYALSGCCIVIANIQILKTTNFSYVSHSIALGTPIFSATYLISDMITEHYGKKAAIRNIATSFAIQIIFSIVMVITMTYPTKDQAVQGAIHTLFAPTIRLFSASIISYTLSHIIDISIFSLLNKLTNGKHLWLRNNVSSITANLSDAFMFNFMSWKLFTDKDISMEELFFTYMTGGLASRIFIGILTTPVIYISKKIKKE